MNYDKTIDFLHSTPWMGKKLGLSQIRELLSMMDDPQDKLKFIHVAGTNGKGSTCEMLASILEAAGYKTGFFISPYINRFNERIQVNHKPIGDDELVEIIGQIKIFMDRMEVPPSEFEVITAAAFKYFCEQNCDYVVLEVGMGGRLDATNIIKTPLAAVIATISLDHTKHLGNTIREIAFEKAGIIKPGGDVIAYGQGGEAAKVFKEICAGKDASLVFSDFSEIKPMGEDAEFQYFSYRGSCRYALSLYGEHQLKNAATVLETVALLNRKGVAIGEEAVGEGLKRASWPGRFELLSRDPLFIADGGHNPEGAGAAVEAFKRRYPDKSAIILIGMSEGKDVSKILSTIDEIAAGYVVIRSDNNARAIDIKTLLSHVTGLGKPAEAADSIRDGITRALSLKKPNDAVFAIGSLYTLGPIREYFGKK